MRRGSVLGLCGMLATAVGCAFTPVPLDMPVSGLPTPLRGGNGRQVAVVVPFADQRPQARRCGMQKNGYNQDTADAVCRVPPDRWIAELLADELHAAGFVVLAPSAARSSNTLVVEGTLLQLFVEPVAGTWVASCEADLQVRLVATSASGLRASRTFFAKGVWKGFAGVTTPFQDSLKKATDEVLGEMVSAIIELADRYPQLGTCTGGACGP
jgi:hypothetical protein